MVENILRGYVSVYRFGVLFQRLQPELYNFLLTHLIYIVSHHFNKSQYLHIYILSHHFIKSQYLHIYNIFKLLQVIVFEFLDLLEI